MMGTFPKREYPIKWVRVSELSVLWAQSQRGLREGRVKQIVEGFDPDAFGVVTATLPNGNGVHHLIDGQHRVEAVRRLWGDSEMVPCTVLNAKDPKDAAHIWRVMNGGRSKPTAMEDFLVAVTEENPEAVEINELAANMGLRIAIGGDDGTLSCVGALRTIYRKHGLEVLAEALRLIRAIYGKNRDAYHSNIVSGVAEVVARHSGNLDPKRLVERTAKTHTPEHLIAAAKAARSFNSRTLTDNVRLVLVSTYNHGLRAELRLDESL